MRWVAGDARVAGWVLLSFQVGLAGCAAGVWGWFGWKNRVRRGVREREGMEREREVGEVEDESVWFEYKL